MVAVDDSNAYSTFAFARRFAGTFAGLLEVVATTADCSVKASGITTTAFAARQECETEQSRETCPSSISLHHITPLHCR
jgi:hypothetical protein